MTDTPNNHPMANLFDPTAGLFEKAVDTYINIVKNKITSPSVTYLDKAGNTYNSKNNLIGGTYARASFTDTEQKYFYEVYDKLWQADRKVEAYCLMRLVFGIMSKAVIEQLYRSGHLFSYQQIFSHYRGRQ